MAANSVAESGGKEIECSRVGCVSGSRIWRQFPLVALATGIASLLNFAFQFIAARMLSPQDYGLFLSLLTVLTVIGAAGTGFQALAARSVSSKIGWSPSPKYLDRTTRQVLTVSFIALAALLLLAGPLGGFLSSPLVNLVVVAVSIPVLFVQSIALGRLQGAGSLILVAAVGLFVAGAKVIGVLLGFVIPVSVPYLLVLLIFVNVLSLVVSAGRVRRTGSLNASLLTRTGSMVILAQFCYWGLAGVDVVVARGRLMELDAGYFAAAATLAKTVLFLPGIITMFVLPHAGNLWNDAARRRILAKRALVVTALISVVATLALFLLGSLLISFAFGPTYVEATAYVGPLALSYVPLALVGVVLQFNFTSGRWLYGLSILGTLVATSLLLILVPPSAISFIVIVGISSTVLLGLLLAERQWVSSKEPAAQRDGTDE